MIRLILILLIGFLASGCATRGALDIPCPGFRSMVTELPATPIEEDIQVDAEWPRLTDAQAPRHDGSDASPLSRAAAQVVARRAAGPRIVDQPSDILLLSGGGQWGAFGSGFLGHLAADRPEHLPRPGLITGVSTGGLQTMYLALADDARFEELLRQYQPESEDEIVDRNAMWLTAVRGSMAGLAPLRRRIERALCTRGDPAAGCPMITALRSEAPNAPHALIGFVEASTGKFLYADVRRLARLDDGSVDGRRRAQQCLTGAALASAAMPVFFQQVRVDRRTYYDGGVRQSVFEAEVGREVRNASRELVRNALLRQTLAPAAASEATVSAPQVAEMLAQATPRVFIIRNGPTVLDEDDGPNESAGPITNALRAEAIIVNELEVGSIAELRLVRPTGDISLITADGFRGVGQCVKDPPNAMFSPSFMKCLARFGAERARRESPWNSIRAVRSFEEEAQRLLGSVNRR